MSIVCDGGSDGENEYCDGKNCGGLLIPLNKNGDSVCTLCEKVYLQNSTKLHRKKLLPDNEEADPMFVPMTNYNLDKKRPQTPGEIEDQAWVKQGQGRSIVWAEETFYE